MRYITHLLLELGFGFAFVARQFRLAVAADEVLIDLLFYHTRLKCYVVVELNAQPFKPEHAGQLNVYTTGVSSAAGAVIYEQAGDPPTFHALGSARTPRARLEPLRRCISALTERRTDPEAD